MISTWTAASSDCGRPLNDDVHIKTADLYRPNARFTPERQRYQVLTPFGKLGYSQIPLPSLEGIVRVKVLAYRFLLSDREIGSLTFVLDPNHVATVQTLTAGVLEAELSLLPPVAIGRSGVQYRRNPKQLATVFWLDTPDECINTMHILAYQLDLLFRIPTSPNRRFTGEIDMNT